MIPRTLLAAAVFTAVLLPSIAYGQAAEATMNVLAFDEFEEKVLIKLHDLNHGVIMREIVIETGKIKRGKLMETRAEEKKYIKVMTRKRYPKVANVDQVGPKGRFTIMGAPDQFKKRYQIMAMRDGKIGVLGKIDLKKQGETYAKGMLKEVVWSPGGRLVVAVVNQKIQRVDGIEDVDEVHFFKFKPWKVQWIKPEAGEEETPDGGDAKKKD